MYPTAVSGVWAEHHFLPLRGWVIIYRQWDYNGPLQCPAQPGSVCHNSGAECITRQAENYATGLQAISSIAI